MSIHPDQPGITLFYMKKNLFFAGWAMSRNGLISKIFSFETILVKINSFYILGPEFTVILGHFVQKYPTVWAILHLTWLQNEFDFGWNSLIVFNLWHFFSVVNLSLCGWLLSAACCAGSLWGSSYGRAAEMRGWENRVIQGPALTRLVLEWRANELTEVDTLAGRALWSSSLAPLSLNYPLLILTQIIKSSSFKSDNKSLLILSLIIKYLYYKV